MAGGRVPNKTDVFRRIPRMQTSAGENERVPRKIDGPHLPLWSNIILMMGRRLQTSVTGTQSVSNLRETG